MSKKENVINKILVRVRNENPDTFNYLVPTHLTKKLKSYMLIREDLIFIQELTRKLIGLKKQKMPDETINTALWFSIIITYGKCFTENKGGMSKLEKSILDDETFKNKETDKNLTELRHSFIAHRDDTDKEQALVFMKIPKNKAIENKTEYLISSAKVLSPCIPELELYLNLFAALVQKVENNIQKQADKTHHAFFDTLTAKQISLLLINNMKLDNH